MAKRVSQARLSAPQSTEEALALLARFAELDAGAAEIRLAADQARALIDHERDQQLAPIAEELAGIVARLKPWWAVKGAEIAGKRKSAQLAGCEIGHRVGNPALDYPKGEEEQLIAALDLLDFHWATRTVRELDKPAILKALRPAEDAPQQLKDDAANLAGLGFGVKQTERFYVERLTADALSSEGEAA